MVVVLRHDRDRSAGDGARGVLGGARARCSGWLRNRGVANPFLIAAVWVLAEATVARVPLGGFSWGEVGYAFHNIGVGRALASDGGVELVTFFAVALNAFLADAVVAARSRHAVPRAAWLRLGAGLTVVVVAAASSPRAVRSAPHPDGHAAGRDPAGQRQEPRSHRRPRSDARYLPEQPLRAGGPGARSRRPGDLPGVEHGRRSPHRPVPARSRLEAIARRTHAWVLANAVADAPAAGGRPAGAKALNLNVLFAARRHRRGDLRQAPSRAVRRVRPVPLRARRRASACSTASRVTSRPATRPGIFEIAGHKVATIICFESAFGYQVRPLVHAGAAGDRRVDQQPLLRAVGELGPARGDRTDRARPRPAGPSCRPRSRGSRRSSTPTGWCTSRPSSSSARCSKPP